VFKVAKMKLLELPKNLSNLSDINLRFDVTGTKVISCCGRFIRFDPQNLGQ
jgi:hypothetical protein